MPLSSGTRLGPYEVVAQIGAGGMGEVYKARDTRLDRTVAIKVLPAALAVDPDFRERFDREAPAISQLTHPHICTLYDVGEDHGTAFLVMELLGGETLADRLTKGALPIDEALTIAIQIADALDAAHRRGIVHRDLKPGNVMLTKGGAKLLDFGLAKAGGSAIAGGGLSMLPTTPPNLTAKGTILGTFQYMAPEQLEGRDADARTDLFALGVMLYEMLTGRRAFEAKSQATLIAAIIGSDPPPVTQLQPNAPASLNRIVATCLAKDPDDRWQSARDLMRELRWVADGGAPIDSTASNAAHASPRSRWSRAMPWMVAGILGAALIAVSERHFRETPVEAPAIRLSIVPPDKTRLFRTPPAVSPDGRQIVFAATSGEGKSQLWLRPLDSLTARPMAGTDGAIYPFWSPDNTSIGFFAAGKLQRMNVAGGPATPLADAPAGRGGTWSPNGVIVFAPSIYSGLHQVAASGGDVRPATRFASGTPTQKFPCFLPDGRHFLYLSGAGGRDQQSIRLGSLDSLDDSRTLLTSADGSAMYGQGQLWFVRGTTLVARPFDDRRFAFTGEEVPAAERILRANPLQSWVFSVSTNGVLAYASAGANLQTLTWVNRAGQPLGTLGEPSEIGGVHISPDRRTVATGIRDASGDGDIWLYDIARGLRTRFTSDPSNHSNPLWSSDGRVIIFDSNRKGRFDLYRKPADGSGAEELLYADNLLKIAESLSPDGAYLAYSATSDPKTGNDIWILPGPLGPLGSKPYPFMRTEHNEGSPQFSPDGHWLAYASNESGKNEIYVTPFPGPGGRRQISTAGGDSPRWQSDGRELFYRAADQRLMAAAVNAKPGTLDVVKVETLFGPLTGDYDISPDGQRFLTPVPVATEVVTPLTVVQNWTAAIKSGK